MINTIRNFFVSLVAPKHRAEGIDGSHWWGWFKPELAKKVIDFIILKATQGKDMINSALKENMKGAMQIDVRGLYHYQRAGVSWLAQADFFLRVAAQYDVHIYALDVEKAYNEGAFTNRSEGETFFSDMRRIIDYWRMKAPAQVTVILYTNTDIYQNYIYQSIKRIYGLEGEMWLEDLEIWLANYNGQNVDGEPNMPTNRKRRWTFWQHSSNGRKDNYGTNGDVDLNVFDGTVEELRARFLGLVAPDPETPEPPPVVVPEPAEPQTDAETWTGKVIVFERMIVRSYPERADHYNTGLRLVPGERVSGRLWVGNGYVWMKLDNNNGETVKGKWVAVRAHPTGDRFIRLDPQPEAPTIPPPESDVDVSIMPRLTFRQWQDKILASNPDIYRLAKWGDEILVKEASRDAGGLTSGSQSNFQAIGLYNKASNTIGGVSNWLRVPRADINRLAAMQREDEYQDKVDDWRDQKMRWLCKSVGTIYFYGSDLTGGWKGVPWTKWGTIGLGDNLVRVEGIETLTVKTPDGVRRSRKMARLAGMRAADWNRPLTELAANGLVQRCFCVYGADNAIGDSPKGIVWSPFWSPRDWDFGGAQGQPDAFYLPLDWMFKG